MAANSKAKNVPLNRVCKEHVALPNLSELSEQNEPGLEQNLPARLNTSRKQTSFMQQKPGPSALPTFGMPLAKVSVNNCEFKPALV
jgi:hypothetical protein